ncbi:Phenol hydroxylase C-terminal dimerization [Penicillium angulare]|uniref:Phenol hydroxylase C-terminal dimerization n=1 Tax=Penicillium angulare TaxID=116970 RepID=UPI00254233E1|nr:Phenol hydroxylase C-terminal dimerization [Penicillium angulare]KAJ5289047.1 Phenol hydroxylase C-terminal dimerization [Penicillium angulare]
MSAQFPPTLVEHIVLHPHPHRSFQWEDIPAFVKQQAEMRFYDGSAANDAYKIYGVNPIQGALAVIRPDGYVGILARLDNTASLDDYLRRCIRPAA